MSIWRVIPAFLFVGSIACERGPAQRRGGASPGEGRAGAASEVEKDDETAPGKKRVQPPLPAEPAPPASPRVATLARADELRDRVASFFQGRVGRRIHIQTDKPLYKPGETIWIRAWDLRARDLAGEARVGGIMTMLVSPKGAVVLRKRVRAQNGFSQSDFDVPAGVPGGEYKLRVRADDGVQSERPIVVSAYEPPRIKKKLEFLRKAYGAGDEVTATISIKRPTGEPLGHHALVGAVRVDGQDLPRVSVRTNAEGGALVRFTLPAELPAGDGLLTVLVEDGGVTESVSKRIPIIVKRMQLAFFPEGGKMIAGLASRTYFEAKTPLGKPADVEGRIVDDHGQAVATFRSYKDGLGRFELRPATGRAYHAEVTKPAGITERFALPLAEEKGCALRTYDDLDGTETALRVAVRCTEKQRVIVTAMLREQLLDVAAMEVAEGGRAVAYLDAKAPALRRAQGIARVTLFDDSLRPLAERVVYRNRRARLGIELAADKARYSPRDGVAIRVRTTDDRGEPVAAELALSVVDDTVLSFADDKTGHILSKLLLEPELPGKVEEPNFYFDLREKKSARALDLLMGTRGWRTFEWRPVLNPPPVSTTTAIGVRGFGVGGGGWAMKRGGRGLRFDVAAEGAPKHAMRPPPPAKAAPAMPVGLAARPAAAMPAAEPPRVALADPVAKPDEAKARGGDDAKKVAQDKEGEKEEQAKRPRARDLAVALPAQPVAAADRPMDPRAGLAEVAGKLGVLGVADGRGRGPWLRNQRRMGGELAADAVGHGELRGIFKGQDKDWARAKNRLAGNAWAFAPVRVFPAPSYPVGELPKTRSDFRETLHWTPSIVTGADGRAEVRFHMSDAITSFRVLAEGVGRGLVGRQEKVLASSLPFSMNVKLPLEVSAGDKVLLPLTFTNERDDALEVKLDASFGALLRPTGAPLQRALRLAPKSRESLFFPLAVGDKAGASQTLLSASAGALKDELTRDVRVVPLGFPQELARSGEARGRVVETIELAEALPGSIEASVRFYPSPVATLQQGMEGLIREPSGCFEQASSTNYPNVMVLQYLQQHDPTALAVLERARGRLERGYRKLTGYESKKGGYEWFGGNPGHEALTAYGVLQFTDMKRVYGEVDEAMIARTAEWLRNRRDGKGHFQRNARALDSFGRASPEVTDAYITYSLTEAGFGTGKDDAAGKVDLSPELARVSKLAKGSTDQYVLALASGAFLSTTARRAEGEALAARLAKSQEGDGSFNRADHSITRSGGVNLRIETTALASMALLKAGGHEDAVRRAMTWLNKNRGGYGQWGTTQATVLALKAMTRYAEASRKTRGPGTLQLRVNGVVVEEQTYEGGRREPIVLAKLGAALRSGSNRVELLHEGSDALPYSLAVAYRTKLPATSPASTIDLETGLAKASVKMGESVRLTAVVRNKTDRGQPMTIARVGLPGGLTSQTWQLKDLRERGVVAFTETGAREVVLYFRDLKPGETKTVPLDLVATVPGEYSAPASSAYLYYTDEHKTWQPGVKVAIAP